jgi:hypothetical protein
VWVLIPGTLAITWENIPVKWINPKNILKSVKFLNFPTALTRCVVNPTLLATDLNKPITKINSGLGENSEDFIF